MGTDLTESRSRRSVEMRDDSPRRERRAGGYDDMEEKGSRESSKHRSKEKSKTSSRREDKDHRSRDQEKVKTTESSKEKEKETKDLEKDRLSSRDRRKEDKDDREKDKARDKDADREKYREKERDKDRKDRGKEKERERVKEKSSHKEKDKEERVSGKDKEREKHKDREREKENDRDRGKDVGGDRDKGKEKDREKDNQSEQDKERQKDREKGKSRDKSKDSERDYSNDANELKTLKNQQNDEVKVAGSRHSASELEERISKSREERLKKSSEDASEVLSWVNKSRLQEKKNAEKEKALQLSKMFEEQDNINDGESDDEAVAQHTTKDLAGVKVLHGLDKVLEGGAVVLTLKDQSILANGDINDEVDMLENVEIGEQKRRNEAYKAAKKKTGVYDDKFSDDFGAGAEKKMLPQYDDPMGDEGVTLDVSGRFTGEAERKLEELRRRLQGGTSSTPIEDLNSTAKISTDYYTQEEMVKFKKPKKKKSLRKKDKLDLDALEAEAKSAGLGAADLGSRADSKRQTLKEEQDKIEAEMRSNAYQSAYARADVASKALMPKKEVTKEYDDVDDDSVMFDDDDDDQLRKSLESARKIALKNQTKNEKSGSISIVLASSRAVDSGAENVATGEQQQENKVVFTEMDEFVWGLQHDEEAHKPDNEDVFMDEDVAPSTSDHEMKDANSGWKEVKETVETVVPVVEESEVVPDETIHESAVGKGLAGALKLLKDRGAFNETIEWGGRNMDKKKSKLVGIYDEENGGEREIHIERTDEYGRILTPKESFRLLSHKFHGKGPGKMKQEKRMRQYQEELKVKQMNNADTPSLSVSRMREAQEKLQTPYLVLSGNVKTGQSSDPRSGFATVEKNHLMGGLTPMLGDRKVEQFLNIRRNAEPTGNSSSQKKPRT